MWGFRGPLGAFVAAWGGVAMITSAPFDDWWHSAYGLDVKILSPPHMVLAAGIFAVHAGSLLLILGQMNRAEGETRTRLRRLFLYVGGVTLVCLSVLQMEITARSAMHTAHFYRLVSMVAPVVLAATARASRYKWAATAVAGVYTLFILTMSWILPLFPAEPKLGPVYHHTTQFTPPEFPLLLLVPALLMDLLWPRIAGKGLLRQAAVLGPIFVLALAAAQWPFADFLMSPWARNWFFGTHYFGYYVAATSMYARYQFYPAEQAFWPEAAAAIVTATVTVALGLAWGTWMQRIRR